jgi:hypothetical protein
VRQRGGASVAEQDETTGMDADIALDHGTGRRHLRRIAKIFLWMVGVAVLLVALAASALTLLVLHGPLQIDSASRAAESILGDIVGPDGHAKVGTAHLDWSWNDGLSVALDEISVVRDGIAALTLPRAAIRLRLLPMLVGDVRPRSLQLYEPRFVFDATAFANAGSPVPGTMGAPGTPPAAADAAPAVVRTQPAPVSTRIAEGLALTIDRALEVAREQGFQTLGLRNGTLDIHRTDAAGAPHRIQLGDIDMEAVVDGPGGEFDAGFSAHGEVGRWSMRLTRRSEGEGHRLAFVADDVTLHDLIGPGDRAFNFSMPFYPRLDLSFSRESRLTGAEFDLRLGAGVFRFGPEIEDEALLDEALAHVVWRPEEQAFVVSNLSWAAGDTNMAMHGRLVPPVATGGGWGISLTADRGGFRPRDVGGDLVPLAGGTITATYDPLTRHLDIAGAQMRFGASSLQAAGRLDLSGPEPRLKADLAFTPMTVTEATHVWPHWVAPDARQWMITQAQAGRIFDARIRLDMPRFDKPETWPGTAMQLTARFDGVRFLPLGNLPAATGAEGRLSVTDRRFEAVVDRAQIATHGPKRPNLDNLRFTVPDIFVKPPKGSIRFQISGDVPAIAEIINAEPLAVLDQAAIKVEGLAGTAVVTSTIDVLFTKVIDPEKIEYKIDAQLDRFSTVAPIQGRKFQDGKFHVVADPRGLEVTGRATVDGVAADVHLYESKGGANRTAEKRDFKMVLDDAARQRVGLDLGGYVQGAIGVSVSQPNPAENRSRFEADLGPTRLVLGQLGWTKGAGVPAKATFDLVDDDKGLHIDNFVLESEGLSLRGALLLDRDRNLVSADFSKVSLRKGDDAKLKVTRGTDKVLAVAIDTTNFDVRGLLQANRKATGGPDSSASDRVGEMVVRIKAGKLVGFNDTTLTDVNIEARHRGGSVATLEAKARTVGGRPFTVSIKPEADHRRFTASTDDAGSVLSFLDLFDRIREGRLVVSARLGAPGTAEGVLRLADFRLMEEPKSGRVAQARETADGIRQIELRRVEFDRSTDFDRASVRFSQRDGVINVAEAVAKGKSVGATATGQIDLNNSRVSLSGTYIPAFGLNNLVGRIPILGAIAGAGSNEGLVGITFRIVGAIEDPILQINPLSAVAPGIFRKIFEFQNEELPTTGTDPNAPTKITP